MIPMLARTSRRAFSLIELVVVIGIVMVLIGLLSPMLRGTWSAAQGSKHLVLAQQHAVLIDQYLQSNKDIYPLHGVIVGEAWEKWYQPLVSSGLLSESDIDESKSAKGARADAFAISVAMVYPREFMQPGKTKEDLWKQPNAPVRRAWVAWPYKKGLLFAPQVEWTGSTSQNPYSGWCCGFESPPGPVAFADNHAETLRWTDCVIGDELVHENLIGLPVATTWDGFAGRDKP